MENKQTNRGFSRIEFIDRYRTKCIFQKSSLATEDCVWLGTESDLMHLTREMAQMIGKHLLEFAKTGEVLFDDEQIEDTPKAVKIHHTDGKVSQIATGGKATPTEEKVAWVPLPGTKVFYNTSSGSGKDKRVTGQSGALIQFMAGPENTFALVLLDDGSIVEVDTYSLIVKSPAYQGQPQ